MSRILTQFLDQLAERFAALSAKLISARVEGLQAVAQAEQQSQLEDLARRYDAEGKPDVAALLRQQALRLTSSDLAAQAVEVMQQTLGEVPRLEAPPLEAPSVNPIGSLPPLPEIATPDAKPRKKPQKAAAPPLDHPLPSLPPEGEAS